MENTIRRDNKSSLFRKNSKIRTKRMQDLKNVRARWKGQCQRSFKTVKKYGN